MDIKTLIAEVREGYMDADLAQLEIWNGQLSTEYAWICEQLAEVKRDRAQKELEIKARLTRMAPAEPGEIQILPKVTEAMVEREYFSTTEGQYNAYASEILKAISKLISAVRFKSDALRGKI